MRIRVVPKVGYLLFALHFVLSGKVQAQTYPSPNPYQPPSSPSPRRTIDPNTGNEVSDPRYSQTVITPDANQNPVTSPATPGTFPSTPGAFPTTPGAIPPGPTAVGYQEPKLNPKPFDPDKIGLTPEQKSQTATELGQVIRLIASKDPAKPPVDLATKALGIALTLDPENRAAVISNLQFQKNVRFENIPPEPSAATVATDLFKTAQSIKDQADPEARKFRAYLLDLAVNIDPANGDVLYEQEMLKRQSVTCDWSSIQGSAGTSSSGPAVVKTTEPKQFSILSLMVSALDSGDFAGRAMNMTATLTPTNSGQPARLMVSGTIGKDMMTSFQETERAVKAQGVVLPPSSDIMVSFGQKYSTKDGPSASVALGLLLMALADKIEVDPQFAVTGDMNVDGTIHAIGAVNAKIRGASLANCSRMAIPLENLRDLEDMAMLQELDTLWKAQIFVVKDLHEASLIAAKNPSPELAKGIAAFAELQEFCKKNPPGTAFSNPFIRQKLAETLAAAPNHASAQILQRYIDRKLPKTLSLKTSINEIFSAAGPFFDFIYKSNKSGSSPKTIFAFAPEVYDKALDRLFAISSQIDPLTYDLHAEINNLIRNWRTASQRTYSETEIRRLVDAANKVDYSLQKIREDHNIQEALSK